ncbi:MAG: glycosyltransferase [Gemmatimonadaceae bacterium]
MTVVEGASTIAAPDPMLEMDGAVDVSVIVTVTERPEPLVALYREYAEPLRATGLSFEFIFVAQPFFPTFTAALAALPATEPVQVFTMGRSVGETALLRLGMSHARGRTILTLPAYRQVEPSALPAVLQQVHQGVDLAVARRWPRRDALVNRIQNRAFHAVLGGLLTDRIHDVACGVRAMRREVLQSIPLYGDFARFLPLLALYNGFTVAEVASPQHGNDRRSRVYSPGVYLRRAIDILGLAFLLRFTEKPLRFFGLVGATVSAIGAGLLIMLFVQRVGGQGIADRPLLLLAVLLLTLGMQAIALGLIGEMIVHFNAPGRRSYRIKGETWRRSG